MQGRWRLWTGGLRAGPQCLSDAVKPTIGAGGQLFLISTSDKRQPMSTFKSLYRAAVAGIGEYRHIFLRGAPAGPR